MLRIQLTSRGGTSRRALRVALGTFALVVGACGDPRPAATNVSAADGTTAEAAPEAAAVAPEALEVGVRYRFAAATPLVEDLDPGDPAMAMAEPVFLPEATEVVVLARLDVAGTVWYQVELDGRPNGWVSLEALRGREVLQLP